MDMKKSTPVILVVDDEDAILELLKEHVIRFFGDRGKYVCETAADGPSARQKIEAQNFDLVFMDVHMPMGDGVEFTRLIREKEKTNGFKPARIICITGWITQEEGERAMTAGADQCLFKPFDWKEIPKLLGEVFP